MLQNNQPPIIITSQTGEPIMGTGIGEMTKTLAGLPESARKQVLTEQLTKFGHSAFEVRKEGVSALLQAICNLPEADCKTVAKSHLQCLCELPEDLKQDLIPLHVEVLKAAPSKHRRMQIEAARELLPSLVASQKAVIEQILRQVGK